MATSAQEAACGTLVCSKKGAKTMYLTKRFLCYINVLLKVTVTIVHFVKAQAQ